MIRETLKSLESMSVDELWKLHGEISATLTRRLAEEKAVLERRLRQLSSGQLKSDAGNASVKRDRRPYPQVLPKYRNPVQTAETWSGRGKQPRWLTAQLKSGKKLDDFRIQRLSTGARRSRGGRKAGRIQAGA